jgi:hypothetical protein
VGDNNGQSVVVLADWAVTGGLVGGRSHTCALRRLWPTVLRAPAPLDAQVPHASDRRRASGWESTVLKLFIDADACAVKEEAYRVAKRHALITTVVANQWIGMPNDSSIRLEVVDDGFDAADNWIVAHAGPGDIIITEDIPLAARCIAAGARVLTGRGTVYDEQSIGSAVAQRGLMQYLREAGAVSGGHKPMQAKDRALFMQELDRLIQSVRTHG